jgi:hypothetical protein
VTHLLYRSYEAARGELISWSLKERGKWAVAHWSVAAAAELAERESSVEALATGDVRRGGSSGRPLAGDSGGNVG